MHLTGILRQLIPAFSPSAVSGAFRRRRCLAGRDFNVIPSTWGRASACRKARGSERQGPNLKMKKLTQPAACSTVCWLVVSTPLKNISQLG